MTPIWHWQDLQKTLIRPLSTPQFTPPAKPHIHYCVNRARAHCRLLPPGSDPNQLLLRYLFSGNIWVEDWPEHYFHDLCTFISIVCDCIHSYWPSKLITPGNGEVQDRQTDRQAGRWMDRLVGWFWRRGEKLHIHAKTAHTRTHTHTHTQRVLLLKSRKTDLYM